MRDAQVLRWLRAGGAPDKRAILHYALRIAESSPHMYKCDRERALARLRFLVQQELKYRRNY